jgi:hypothetical protein
VDPLKANTSLTVDNFEITDVEVYVFFFFCFAGVCDADQGTEPSAGTLAGARRGDCRAQGGTQQYSGKS